MHKLSSILTEEGLLQDKNPLVRLAGWTAGVFDEKECRTRIASPLLTACQDALDTLGEMNQENLKYLKTYQMAGMEYREEAQAALASQAVLRKYGEALRDLQRYIIKMAPR